MKVHNKIIKAFGALLIAALLFAAMPAGEVKAQSTITVCPEGTPTCDFATIQGAINAASDGDTIHVAAGTYVITSQIVIDKDISIIGEDKTSTIIQAGAEQSSYLFRANGSFDIYNVTIDGAEFDVYGAVRMAGSGTIDNNIIKNIVSPSYQGFGVVVYSNDVTISNNTLSDIGRVGIYVGGENVSVTNNQYTGKGVGDWLDYGIEVGMAGSATITGNMISNCLGVAQSDGSTSAAIIVNDLYGSPVTATVINNQLKDSTAGLLVGYDETDTSTVTATGNTFTGNEYQLSAENPVNINITDALTNNTFDKAVVIDDGLTIFSSIQDAIDDTSDGDTINVAAGTYDETLNIDSLSNLTIIGADPNTTIVKSSSLLGWNVGGYGEGRKTVVRVVNSTGIEISGFTFDLDLVKGNNTMAALLWDSTGTLDGNVFKNNQVSDSSGGYYELGAYLRAPSFTDTTRAFITVNNNIFENMGRVALNSHDYVEVTITGNSFYKTEDDFGYGIELGSESTGEISNNEFYGFDTPAASDGSKSAAIYVENSFTNDVITGFTKSVVISDNEVHDNQWGVYIGNEFENYAGDVDIDLLLTGNNIFDNMDGGVGITDEGMDMGSSVAVTGSDNTLTNNGEYGYLIFTRGNGSVTTSFTGETIEGHNTAIHVEDTEDPSTSFFSVDIQESNLSGNINYAVYSAVTGLTVDASPNWWGSAAGPEAGTVEGDVDYTPWCGDEACTTFFPNDDDEIVLPEGVTAEEIQTAINNAPSGTTIIIPAGTYTGGLTIDNPGLTINLNGATIGPGSPAFTITADNTIINGPGTLDGGGSSDHAIVVADGVTGFTLDTVEIKGWDDGLHFDGVINNTVIVDNFIHDNTGDGVYFGAQPVDQTGYSFYIQGNLFKDNGGVAINNTGTGTTAINAEFNSWGDVAGTTITNVDTDPFTHVDLYMVSTNPDVDNWPNQVFVDEDITYQVKANMVNVSTAAFEFSYPTDLLGSPVFSSVNANFYPVPTKTEIVTVNETTGVISFEGQTGEYLVALTPLTGDIVLFEVTFTATSTPGTATLDFNEETDEFGMSPNYGPSNNIYADAMVDATLDVITRPTLTADGLSGPYVAGLRHEFTTTIANAATGGEWIESLGTSPQADAIAWIRITDMTEAGIHSLQFKYGGVWHNFDVQGGTVFVQDGSDLLIRFGNNDVGFDIGAPSSETDEFAVTFINPGTHDVTFEIYDMMDTPLDRSDDILLTDLGPVSITVDGNFDVTGTIAMQGRTVRSGVPLTLTDVDGAPLYGPFDVFSTSELAYNVLFPAGVNGSIYEITTSQPRYLNVHDGLDKQFLVNGDYTIDALELKGGNAVWSDNLINIQDASAVGTDYGKTGDLDADVNFDGKVSIQDLALVGGNFDLTSATAYASWTP